MVFGLGQYTLSRITCAVLITSLAALLLDVKPREQDIIPKYRSGFSFYQDTLGRQIPVPDIYRDRCAGCHRMDGTGKENIGPDLYSPFEFIDIRNRVDFFEFVRNCTRRSNMPSMEDIDDGKVRDTGEYIRFLNANENKGASVRFIQ